MRKGCSKCTWLVVGPKMSDDTHYIRLRLIRPVYTSNESKSKQARDLCMFMKGGDEKQEFERGLRLCSLTGFQGSPITRIKLYMGGKHILFLPHTLSMIPRADYTHRRRPTYKPQKTVLTLIPAVEMSNVTVEPD